MASFVKPVNDSCTPIYHVHTRQIIPTVIKRPATLVPVFIPPVCPPPRFKLMKPTVNSEVFYKQKFVGHLDPPRVHLEPPRVYLDPPCVHLDPPCVHLEPPCVHLDPPCVHLEPPHVHLDLPHVHLDPPRTYLNSPLVCPDPPRVRVRMPGPFIRELHDKVHASTVSKYLNKAEARSIKNDRTKAYTGHKVNGVKITTSHIDNGTCKTAENKNVKTKVTALSIPKDDTLEKTQENLSWCKEKEETHNESKENSLSDKRKNTLLSDLQNNTAEVLNNIYYQAA